MKYIIKAFFADNSTIEYEAKSKFTGKIARYDTEMTARGILRKSKATKVIVYDTRKIPMAIYK